MNTKRLKIWSIAAICVLSACSKDYLDINKNPNKPSNVTPGLVLTNALNSTATSTTGSTEFYAFSAAWIGYWNFSGAVAAFAEERSYQFTSNYGPLVNIWNNLYHNLEDYDYVGRKGLELKNPFYVAVSKTMKAYDFQNLVDIYNNVPYREALKSTAVIRPAYDKAQDIYEDLARQLDTAASLFKANIGKVSTNDGNFDIMYKGDALKWGRFANTLKLRLLLRQSEMPGRAGYINSEIAKINANGMGYIGIEKDGGAFVNPGYTNSDGKQNPFWKNFGYSPANAPVDNHRYYIASEYAINFYQNNNDPRLGKLYTTLNDGKGTTYSGSRFGPTATSPADDPINRSSIGRGLLKGADMPQPLFTNFESLFLQAEAAQRGYIAGSARGFYEQAVTQNFSYLGADGVTAYLAQSEISNWDLATDKLKLIITQKWAAMNGINDMESWADFRRLNIPADIPVSDNPAATTRKIPVRMLYPQSEYNYNPDNVLAQGQISQFTSRIFWDVN